MGEEIFSSALIRTGLTGGFSAIKNTLPPIRITVPVSLSRIGILQRFPLYGGNTMATFENYATLSYNGGMVATSNTIEGEIRETLTAAKYSVPRTYSTGSDIAYIISLVNTGSESYDDLTITDNLGQYTYGDDDDTAVPLSYNTGSVAYYVNGTQQGAPTVTPGPPLTISGISVPAGGNAVIVYSAKANEFAPLGTDAGITNTAVISGDGIENISVSTEITNDVAGVRLALIKALSPTVVDANGVVTYTFTLQNFGSEQASGSDIIFSDTFEPALSNLTAQFNGTAWSQGTNYNYVPGTGVFTSLADQITIPPAQFDQNPSTGEWSVEPGTSTLIITGNIG